MKRKEKKDDMSELCHVSVGAKKIQDGIWVRMAAHPKVVRTHGRVSALPWLGREEEEKGHCIYY